MPLQTTSADWDKIRAGFASSILADTSLNSLAQNVDSPAWPLTGPEETPAGYIDFNFDDVQTLLASKGVPPERLDQLADILRETLAFDDPFGDMVTQIEESSERDNPILKNLGKLGIPETFPLVLTAISPETRDFCDAEKITTLGEFSLLAQSISQRVVVGGDFRALLNALSHVDEPVLARYLPFRPGSGGLHLIEAVGQLVAPLPAAQRDLASLPNAARTRLDRMFAHFADEVKTLHAQTDAGTPLSRLVMVLNQPDLEPAVAALLEPYVVTPPSPPPAKTSWFSRLFSR